MEFWAKGGGVLEKWDMEMGTRLPKKGHHHYSIPKTERKGLSSIGNLYLGNQTPLATSFGMDAHRG